MKNHNEHDEFLEGAGEPELPKEWRWPPALEKACFDQFFYEAGLRDGRTIRFGNAKPLLDGHWVVLYADCYDGRYYEDHEWHSKSPRGVEVRLADIVWISDAPDGS